MNLYRLTLELEIIEKELFTAINKRTLIVDYLDTRKYFYIPEETRLEDLFRRLGEIYVIQRQLNFSNRF